MLNNLCKDLSLQVLIRPCELDAHVWHLELFCGTFPRLLTAIIPMAITQTAVKPIMCELCRKKYPKMGILIGSFEAENQIWASARNLD